jgi:rubredoxin
MNKKLGGQLVMKKYQCTVCGYVYEEAKGCPDQGIAPGTKWEDVPDSFVCPECGVGKDSFEPAD